MNAIWALLLWFRGVCLSCAALSTENLALRQQLSAMRRQSPRPQLNDRDRLFWICMKMLWPSWREALQIVTPETVVRWHRNGFRYYWRWKSRPRGGRKKIDQEIRELIRRMARENSTWGTPRIQSELAMLEYSVAESTVAKYMPLPPRRPSIGWNTFLRAHLHETVGIDFLTVPTATFRLLYCFVILHHDRRHVLHVNVTTHPSSQWIAQQLTEAFPYEQAPRFLVRDGDKKYGDAVERRLQDLGIQVVQTSPESPWQNPFVERFIGSLRRECLNHVIVLSEGHLKRIVEDYLDYYHNCRTHLSLHRTAPNRREPVAHDTGPIVSIPKVGGLHHEYRRVA